MPRFTAGTRRNELIVMRLLPPSFRIASKTEATICMFCSCSLFGVLSMRLREAYCERVASAKVMCFEICGRRVIGT